MATPDPTPRLEALPPGALGQTSLFEELEEERHRSAQLLHERFVVPPFSTLDTRAGYWQERRGLWHALGLASAEGRSSQLLSTATRREWGEEWDTSSGQNAWAGHGTSVFDPVLAELLLRWFVPPGGAVLDPFAGGSVRGVVAAVLGLRYTGIDLSGEQLRANRAQAGEILRHDEPVPVWLEGDARELHQLLPPGELYDGLISCPPYYDLEVYSDHPAELSAMPTYAAFLEAYREVIRHAAERLRPGAMASWVVGEVRSHEGLGAYHGLVPDTVQAWRDAGLELYNDAVLLNGAGSLPVRAPRYFEGGRKLGRSHQSVLVFRKPGPRWW